MEEKVNVAYQHKVKTTKSSKYSSVSNAQAAVITASNYKFKESLPSNLISKVILMTPGVVRIKGVEVDTSLAREVYRKLNKKFPNGQVRV